MERGKQGAHRSLIELFYPGDVLKMNEEQFQEFLAGDDTLHVYRGGVLVFKSQKDRLLPLLEYLESSAGLRGVVVMDKVMGNAAALLSIKAGCEEVYSPLGSDYGIDTLERYGIKYHIMETVPFITRADGVNMCPMEELSLGKNPEEFYQAMKSRMANH
jgi:hypothetical protein